MNDCDGWVERKSAALNTDGLTCCLKNVLHSVYLSTPTLFCSTTGIQVRKGEVSFMKSLACKSCLTSSRNSQLTQIMRRLSLQAIILSSSLLFRRTESNYSWTQSHLSKHKVKFVLIKKLSTNLSIDCKHKLEQQRRTSQKQWLIVPRFSSDHYQRHSGNISVVWYVHGF